MTTKCIINVYDLGPGDGGKGGVVHYYTTHHSAHTVLKVGGAQGSHGVSTEKHDFAFSQWGCGTLENVPTFITSNFVVCPDSLISEAKALISLGISDVYELMTVAELCLCSTPYHGLTSRIKELLLGNNPRGTIGSGVGQAFRRNHTNHGLSLRMMDFKKGIDHVKRKLSRIRACEKDIVQYLSTDCLLPSDVDDYNLERSLFDDDGFFEFILESYKDVIRNINVVNEGQHLNNIFKLDGYAVVENSHGILTDSAVGLNPHTSALRTLPQFTRHLLRYNGYTGPIKNIGVHRAYSIRHGAGPLPTDDPGIYLLPGSCKDENRYQGKVRVGALDFVLLRYACSHVSGALDGLAITWFDQVIRNGHWNICNEYSNTDDSFCSPCEIMPIYSGFDNSKIAKSLFNVIPAIETVNLPESITDQFELCCKIIHDKLKVPVDLVSFGPMDSHKLVRGITNV